MMALKRVFKYLKGKPKYRLRYSRREENVCISTDASWDTTIDAKSYSGYVVRLGDAIIGWKSQKQNLVALFTCEAE